MSTSCRCLSLLKLFLIVIILDECLLQQVIVDWLVNDVNHSHFITLTYVRLVNVAGNSHDLHGDHLKRTFPIGFPLYVLIQNHLLIFFLELQNVLCCRASIHYWHVDVHQDQAEANTTVALLGLVSRVDKFLHSLCAIKGLDHFNLHFGFQ